MAFSFSAPWEVLLGRRGHCLALTLTLAAEWELELAAKNLVVAKIPS
jgi:hypothetical protein